MTINNHFIIYRSCCKRKDEISNMQFFSFWNLEKVQRCEVFFYPLLMSTVVYEMIGKLYLHRNKRKKHMKSVVMVHVNRRNLSRIFMYVLDNYVHTVKCG